MDSKGPMGLSRQYLQRVKTGDTVRDVREKLAVLPTSALEQTLTTDAAKIAFWTNVYNAATHDTLRENTAALENKILFFYTPRVRVAGHFLSLNGVEHGILRRGKLSFLLGRGPEFPIRPFCRIMRPSELDYRIHFLLNCGAESCPAVRGLDENTYDSVADEATRVYLKEETEWKGDVLVVPRILRWYKGDFGGKDGIYNILNEYDIIRDETPPIKYAEYDWTPNPL